MLGVIESIEGNVRWVRDVLTRSLDKQLGRRYKLQAWLRAID